MSELWDLMRGATATRALAVVGDLRIADELADGPRSVADLARATGADADTLQRILRALASDGVFAEDEPGIFRNTDVSERLRHEGTRAFAHQFGGVFYDAMRTLDPRTRQETFSQKFGTDFWSWLAANREERALFDAAMSGGKDHTADRLAELEWREDELVVDIGGGNGALLRALLERRPELNGIVFDLPETVRDEAALGRIRFVGGSFFESVPGGDAYVLSAILHDWDDECAAAILRTIRAAAPEGARLLLVESVVAPGNEPQGSKWLDLLMLVLAAGRERTEQDWRTLLDEAGYSVGSIEDGLIQATCR